MNMQKCAKFVKTNMKMNMLKIKNIEKLGTMPLYKGKFFTMDLTMFIIL